ncbi:MAG: glycosyltransferase family 2 protein [bacterium]|nr:glycosyltransferase family 2 protein [bacterium]
MGKLLLYGMHFIAIAFALRIIDIVFTLKIINICSILFYSGVVLVLLNFIFSLMFRYKRAIMVKPLKDEKICVAVTAYNDELSIGGAVKDFRQIPFVNEVIVVDNNCKDRTIEFAKKEGANIVVEEVQGYGAACMRGLKEASKRGDIIVLVEGDGTFSARDLNKFVSYLENADMVVGTRTTRELSSADCQMSWFIQYGNIFMAKLIQLVYFDTRLTDIGCTYRIIRKEALDKIIGQLKVTSNHFSCEMILIALKNKLKIIEIPITFRKRIGESKGVGGNMWRGLKTGFRMWWLILRI